MSNRLVLAVGAVVLVASACATTGDTTTTAAAATSTTATTATTTSTVAPSTSTTVPVTEDVVTASGPLSLPGYLAASYRLDGWFTESVTEATLNSPPDEVLGMQAAIYEEYVGVLRSLEPPPEAVEYHQLLLELMERALETTRRAAEAVDSGDPDAALEASEELIALGQEMVAESFTIAVAQSGLVNEVLADEDDPESRYILELLALQNSESTTTAGALLAEATSPDLDLDELGALYRDLVGLFESTLADYEGIAPPASWQSVYDGQIDLLVDGIALYSAIADAIETRTEPELPVLLALIDFAQRGPAQTAAVSEQMASHFERIDGSG